MLGNISKRGQGIDFKWVVAVGGLLLASCTSVRKDKQLSGVEFGALQIVISDFKQEIMSEFSTNSKLACLSALESYTATVVQEGGLVGVEFQPSCEGILGGGARYDVSPSTFEIESRYFYK